MALANAYTAYQKTNITTASQGRLVVLLYEAAIKNLRNARSLIDDGGKIKPESIEKFGTYLQKTQAIITELQVSLDMKQGEIAKNLMSLYLFFNSQIMEAGISHESDKIENVEKMMSELLEAWKVASNSTANTADSKAASQSVLNIQG